MKMLLPYVLRAKKEGMRLGGITFTTQLALKLIHLMILIPILMLITMF